MFWNKFTGIILTDEEYWKLRKREVRQLWEDMNKEDKQEWSNFQEFEEWELERNVDLDYEYIEN